MTVAEPLPHTPRLGRDRTLLLAQRSVLAVLVIAAAVLAVLAVNTAATIPPEPAWADGMLPCGFGIAVRASLQHLARTYACCAAAAGALSLVLARRLTHLDSAVRRAAYTVGAVAIAVSVPALLAALR